MCSLRAGRRTDATATIRTACSTTTSTRWCSSLRPPTSRISTSNRWSSSASIRKEHDIRFVEDDWESPTLGAWGLGWEVWLDGMEVTQFTYFQEVGGLACKPVLGEITYGLERLAMYLQGKDSVYDLVWTPGVTYGDVYHQNEVEQSQLQLRAVECRHAVPAFRRIRRRSQAPDRGAMRAAGLRDGDEVLAHLQPARRARRDLGHRARRLHRPRACDFARRRAGLLRVARAARLSDGEAHG